jgi:hypothetical protein
MIDKKHRKILDKLAQMTEEERAEYLKGAPRKVRYIQGSYTTQMKKKAFKAFLEAGTLEGAAKLMEIPLHVMSRWYEENNWEEQREKKEQLLITDEDDMLADLTIAQLCQTYGIPASSAETLKEIKIIAGICFAAIKDPEKLEGKVALYPRSFESALSGLRSCWAARLKIFSNKESGEEKRGKPDIMAAAVNGNVESGPQSLSPALLRQLRDIE